jgi:hypothetical protein
LCVSSVGGDNMQVQVSTAKQQSLTSVVVRRRQGEDKEEPLVIINCCYQTSVGDVMSSRILQRQHVYHILIVGNE